MLDDVIIPPRPFPRLSPWPALYLLVRGYEHGAFPMADDRHGASINFYTTQERCIFPLDGALRWSRSLRSLVRSNKFTITTNTAFSQVILACADAPRTFDPLAGELPGTWINNWIIYHYQQLHQLGMAHSVEAWLSEPGETRGRLVGGLYGVQLGSAFFGESMFSDLASGGSGASKCCLFALVAHLRAQGFALLDSQIANDHVLSLGAQTIDPNDYANRLDDALDRLAQWQTQVEFSASVQSARLR